MDNVHNVLPTYSQDQTKDSMFETFVAFCWIWKEGRANYRRTQRRNLNIVEIIEKARLIKKSTNDSRQADPRAFTYAEWICDHSFLFCFSSGPLGCLLRCSAQLSCSYIHTNMHAQTTCGISRCQVCSYERAALLAGVLPVIGHSLHSPMLHASGASDMHMSTYF